MIDDYRHNGLITEGVGMATGVDWVEAGPVTICEHGAPLFPMLPRAPGLYRIRLSDGRVYIGQAQDLRRRLGEYRRPTKGNEGEHVMHHEIKDALGGHVDIFVGDSLNDRKSRMAFERAEIAATFARGDVLMNDDAPLTVTRLQAKIRYHERQIGILRSKLAELAAVEA
jgi:hypothetical protein